MIHISDYYHSEVKNGIIQYGQAEGLTPRQANAIELDRAAKSQ